MAYTPTTWVTGDTVTATKLNKLEQGVANAGGGGCAIVELSATGYPTASNFYGFIVYAVYDDGNSRWVITQDDSNYWGSIFGFANEAPKIIPPYLTVLPNSDNAALFFVNDNATVTVSGDIEATNLYLSYGSLVLGAYRITGDGSISVTSN